jgi:hypothetical protein
LFVIATDSDSSTDDRKKAVAVVVVQVEEDKEKASPLSSGVVKGLERGIKDDIKETPRTAGISVERPISVPTRKRKVSAVSEVRNEKILYERRRKSFESCFWGFRIPSGIRPTLRQHASVSGAA